MAWVHLRLISMMAGVWSRLIANRSIAPDRVCFSRSVMRSPSAITLGLLMILWAMSDSVQKIHNSIESMRSPHHHILLSGYSTPPLSTMAQRVKVEDRMISLSSTIPLEHPYPCVCSQSHPDCECDGDGATLIEFDLFHIRTGQ